MWAHVEHFDGGVIRVFDSARKFGEPYLYSVAFKWIGPKLIELVGATRPPTPSQWRAIRQLLRPMGIRVRFERKSGARPGSRLLE